jgi:chemotaxis signal transduction protein
VGTEATLTDVLPASGQVADDAVAGRAAGGVLLRLGSSRYAVAMADVAEVAAVPGVTRVPGSPPWLSGVANWRGRMLPVLDLRPLLATPTVPLASSARLVVLGRDDVVVGLVVEAVPGVYDGDLGDLAPAPPTLGPDAGLLVLGQLADRNGPVAVLDAGAVLALRDRVDRRRHVG